MYIYIYIQDDQTKILCVPDIYIQDDQTKILCVTDDYGTEIRKNISNSFSHLP
jgi:hypothetical protein